MNNTIYRLKFTRDQLEIIIEMFDEATSIHPLQRKYLRLYNYLKNELDGE